MGTAKRIKLGRTLGWRMPENAKKVDRSGKWGNPFSVERKAGRQWNPKSGLWEEMWELRHPQWVRGDIFPTKASAAQMAVLRHACEVAPLLDLEELRGLDLGCWCKLCDRHKDGLPFGEECPDCAPCHADTLGTLANASQSGDAA